MGCVSQRAGGCQSGPGGERMQIFYINFLSEICPQFKWTGTITEKNPPWDGRPRNWTFFGKLVMQCFIMQKVHRLSVFWHLKQHPLPFFPLANPMGLRLGGKRQALPLLVLRSCAGAHAWQLIILFIIMAPWFAVPFESIISITRANYIWVGKEVNADLKIDPQPSS